MLAIVSREDADGDNRMMGSLDRDGFDGFGVGIDGITEVTAVAVGCDAGGWPGRCGRDLVGGIEEAAAAAAAAAVAGLVVRSRVMKSSACLRTCEKSCIRLVRTVCFPSRRTTEKGTNSRFDTAKQRVTVRDDALVAVDLEQARVRRAHLPGQYSSAAPSVSGAATATATATTAPSLQTSGLLLRACGCCRCGRGRERFNELAFFLAAFEPRYKFKALEEREVRDSAIAERLGLANVVWDGVLAVLPREEDGPEVDGGAIGLMEAGGGGEEVRLDGGMGEEQVRGGG